MSFSTTAPFMNASREHSPSMSHSSKTASLGGSEFGKLTLGGSSGSSRSDEMKTRSMVKRAATKEVPASSSSRSKGKVSAAESSRRGTKASTARTPAKRQARDVEGEGNDPDDSGDSSSDDDDDRSSQRRVSSPPQLSIRDRLRLVMSAYDPSQRSPVEFTHLSDRELPESSRIYRAQIDDFSRLITTPEALEPFTRRLHLSSPMWGSLVVRAQESRMRTNMSGYLASSSSSSAHRQDAIDTISEFNKLFASIEALLLQPVFRTMDSAARGNLALLAMQMLEFIVAQNTDARGSVGVPYAGGSRHHEYNLYMRFARSEWNVAMAKLNAMVTSPDVRALFMRAGPWACLMRAYQTVGQRHPPPVPGEVGDFCASLRTLVGRLQNREA